MLKIPRLKKTASMESLTVEHAFIGCEWMTMRPLYVDSLFVYAYTYKQSRGLNDCLLSIDSRR